MVNIDAKTVLFIYAKLTYVSVEYKLGPSWNITLHELVASILHAW